MYDLRCTIEERGLSLLMDFSQMRLPWLEGALQPGRLLCDDFAVFRNNHVPQIQCADVSSSYGKVAHRVHVAGDDESVLGVFGQGGDILCAHDEFFAGGHTGSAGVDDNHSGMERIQRRLDFRAPDGITGNVESLLPRGRKNDSHGIIRHTDALADGLDDFSATVLAAGFEECGAVEGSAALVEDSHIREIKFLDESAVVFTLHEEGKVLLESAEGELIDVIRVPVRQNHRVHIDNFRDADGKIAARLADVRVDGRIEAGHGFFGQQPRIN